MKSKNVRKTFYFVGVQTKFLCMWVYGMEGCWRHALNALISDNNAVFSNNLPQNVVPSNVSRTQSFFFRSYFTLSIFYHNILLLFPDVNKSLMSWLNDGKANTALTLYTPWISLDNEVAQTNYTYTTTHQLFWKTVSIWSFSDKTQTKQMSNSP